MTGTGTGTDFDLGDLGEYSAGSIGLMKGSGCCLGLGDVLLNAQEPISDNRVCRPSGSKHAENNNENAAAPIMTENAAATRVSQ